MRFAFASSGSRFSVWLKQAGALSLAGRLALILLPPSVLLCLFAGWLGFSAASATLEDALAAIPLMEAKVQTEKIENTFKGLRAGLFTIAQSPDLSPSAVHEKLHVSFHEHAPLIAEIAFKAKEKGDFLFLRDQQDRFIPVPPTFAFLEPHSLFTQISSMRLLPGEAILFPATRMHYAHALVPEQVVQTPVIRMALALADNRGTLIVGLDLERLRSLLAVYAQPDSPLRTPVQEGALQLAYYFETTGWMLFEFGGQFDRTSPFPDTSRRGYEGDLGRPGYDAAFRPWAVHESYWRMIAATNAGVAGVLPVSARHYSPAHASIPTSLCYAPVKFSPTPGGPAQVVGGIAFLEASQLPLTAFFRAANMAVVIGLGSFLLLGLVVFVTGKRLGQPLRGMAAQMQSMLHTGRFMPLACRPFCEEQQLLLEAGNEIINRNLALQADLGRMQHEMQQARAILPIDLEGVLATTLQPSASGLVGSSLLMQKVREEVRKAGRAGADVLVWGETGTGKELVAAAIHQAGVSTKGPFISINCGALDENLLLDTLFGHIKGAFSEAKTDRKGAFVAAEGGTLFLDEIANASLKVQQALLRALSVRRIRTLGTDMEIPFTARVVAATNVDLREQVRMGLFREDLYYRLAIIDIATPALRERKEDIPELAAFFIREAAKKLARGTVRLSRGALEAMMEHSWPGNVRELKNCITRAMAFMEGDLILRQHILIDHAPAKDTIPVGQNTLSVSAKEEQEKEPFGFSWEYLWPHSAPPKAASIVSTPAPEQKEFFSPPAVTVEQPQPPQSQPPREVLPALNERQLLALQYIRKKGGITRGEYEMLAGQGISACTMQNDLRALIDLGVIKRVGGGPKTRYALQE